MPAASHVVSEPIENTNHQLQQMSCSVSVAPANLLRLRLRGEIEELEEFIDACAGQMEFAAFEEALVVRVFAFGRILMAFFLQQSAQGLEVPTRLKRGRQEFKRQPPKCRSIGTFFGEVPYWRYYAHRVNGRGGGFYPLDQKLGLTADRFSFGVLTRAALLATMLSYATARETMKGFLGWAPSTKTIERAVLGLGTHTEDWFASAPAPDGDGEVLIIQIDGKATPTATDSELEKRRRQLGPRSQHQPKPKRLRDREARRQQTRTRRKKGDKAKNGRMVTVVVMYTLKRSVDGDGNAYLEGPINRRVYASYAPKRHAFAIARREADKRGFTQTSGRPIQLVTDGDSDYPKYAAEFLPNATHTLDVIHAEEYIWGAGSCLFEEGSTELRDWVGKRKTELYEGRVWDMLDEMNEFSATCTTKKKCQRLKVCINYLLPRAHMMNYAEITAKDLERGTGIVEGAVRYLVAQRFDEGGMRWIRERAEPLLQLRCINTNGDWDAFVRFAHDRVAAEQRQRASQVRILRSEQSPLPTFGLAA